MMYAQDYVWEEMLLEHFPAAPQIAFVKQKVLRMALLPLIADGSWFSVQCEVSTKRVPGYGGLRPTTTLQIRLRMTSNKPLLPIESEAAVPVSNSRV